MTKNTAVAGDEEKIKDDVPVSLIDMLERFLLAERERHLQGVYTAERSLAEIGRPVSRPTRPYRKVK